MGADSFLLYFGVRQELSEAECEACERKQHVWQILSRQAGLKNYWGKFYANTDRYIILIGHQFGPFGAEGASNLEITSEEFARISNDVTEKLRSVGIGEVPALQCLYEPDS